MDSSMNMAEGIFGRCPTCLRNIFQLICDLTCSPEQGRFLRVTDSIKEKNITYVNEVDVIPTSIIWFLREFFS